MTRPLLLKDRRTAGKGTITVNFLSHVVIVVVMHTWKAIRKNGISPL
jgi:hypothetical protein